MRNRVLVIVSIAVLGSAITAGVVVAQGDAVIGVGGAEVTIDVPGGGSLPDVNGVIPACSNGADDDGDGAIDAKDPDCADPTDTSEGGSGNGGSGGSGSGGTVKPPRNVGVGGGKGGNGGGPREIPGDDLNPQAPVEPDPSEHDGRSGKGDRKPNDPEPDRKPDGSPTNSNPTLTIADFGPAPIGVPNFVIDRFSIPPFLIPIYQACGTQYDIPWEILASINRIETAFGTNLNVSSAGALGWMQFIPSTWKAYGVDANRDGRKDPYNPLDAICAAARYLNAAGGADDLRRAIFAYNHADWYVDEVLLYARQYGDLPADLIGSLTGLTEGARFPIAAKARYADDISEREAKKRSTPRAGSAGNAADVISDSPTRRGIDIFAKAGSPIVAVNDAVVKKIGKSKRLGKFMVIQDVYGNRYIYADIGKIAGAYPVPEDRELTGKDFKLVRPGKGDAPNTSRPASSTTKAQTQKDDQPKAGDGPVNTEDARDRLYALPERPANVDNADLTGQLDSLFAEELPGYGTVKAYVSGVLRYDAKTMESKALREGAKVVGGTILGRVGKASDGTASHLHFAIKPAGRGSKRIDPKPILDGWKLLEATAIYRAAGRSPFNDRTSVGEILLMSKTQLIRRVLSDHQLEIYSCGRDNIKNGEVDRRLLATLAYLSERGFRLTITSLKCGHGFYTASGNVSEHSSGNAVDIAQINGIPVLGNQGKGSITEALVRDLLQLQGSMQPHQIISLMQMGGPTFAMADHADHVHVGFQPLYDTSKSARFTRLLKPSQWQRLVERIGQIDQPVVPTKASDASLPAKKSKRGRASDAHLGE